MTKLEFERDVAPTLAHLWPKRFSDAPPAAVARWYEATSPYSVDVVQMCLWAHADESLMAPTPGRIAIRIREQLGNVGGQSVGPVRPDASWAEVQRRYWEREDAGFDGASMSDEEIENKAETAAAAQGYEHVKDINGRWTGHTTHADDVSDEFKLRWKETISDLRETVFPGMGTDSDIERHRVQTSLKNIGKIPLETLHKQLDAEKEIKPTPAHDLAVP